jgi:hypothetical protein
VDGDLGGGQVERVARVSTGVGGSGTGNLEDADGGVVEEFLPLDPHAAVASSLRELFGFVEPVYDRRFFYCWRNVAFQQQLTSPPDVYLGPSDYLHIRDWENRKKKGSTTPRLCPLGKIHNYVFYIKHLRAILANIPPQKKNKRKEKKGRRRRRKSRAGSVAKSRSNFVA